MSSSAVQDTAAVGCSVKEIRSLVVELNKRMDAHQRGRSAEFDLTPTQAKALEELGRPRTARELAAILSCEPPNVTYVVDKLEKRGLVVREPHPQDRRAKRLVLTDAGRELRLALLRRIGCDSPLDHMSHEERAVLRDQLARALEGA
ncbi:MarR family winged helix-turn-helix transcriptional regulator [Streptomyces aureoversilis]|uniref:MarR family winged helix-turn-helix transcriptional regulator n=1 Tax=Streptomyces aureoversilis TaxID=67277 RepID=A0ABW0A4K2_9ACTN